MWLMTKVGFFSVVANRDVADNYLVRARVKGDLVNLKKLGSLEGNIITLTKSDYRHRIYITKEELNELMLNMVEEIDYDNFKNMIAKTPGQKNKLDAYHDVWGIMYELQD